MLEELANEFRFLEDTFGANQVEADVETIMSLIGTARTVRGAEFSPTRWATGDRAQPRHH